MLTEEARIYEQNYYWNLHLEWLLENKPQFVKRLFFKDREKLRMFLSQKVKQAMDIGYRLQEKGLPPNEVEEYEMEVIAPPPPENEPEPLPESLRAAILLWAENPDEG